MLISFPSFIMTIILASIMLPKLIPSIGLYSIYANRISLISSFLKLPQENKARMINDNKINFIRRGLKIIL
ncbi:MAG: hypothetical protein CL844_09550 [Crocinitomicaceae bacterium]|nr:hypothetical protein [Crocinitomicaceae bacterium]